MPATANTSKTSIRKPFRRQRKHSSNISLEQASMMELADKATDDHEHAACLREMYQLI